MKLVDENGRFQLVKNGQVVIDNTLPKYQKIGLINKSKNEGVSLSAYMASDSDSESLSNGITVDKTIRDLIQEMTSSTLKEYLSSEDANEFNEKFKPILEAEKDANSYSVNVTSNRWTTAQLYDNSVAGYPVPYNPKGLKYKIGMFIDNLKKVFKQTNNDIEESEAALKVLDFFDIIHVEAGKEKAFVNKLEGYFNLIRNAALMHQDAQLDELCQRVILHIYESVLAVHGYNKYIEFSEIEKMKCVGKKVVDIDYIKNFGRIIPSDVVDKKLACDKFGVFDNYCVMYYDPTGETYIASASARRDPILFGLINHSEKLYYIADWEDDKCDLTLEKVAELCTVEDLNKEDK